MISSDSKASISEINDVVAALRGNGVRLWSEDGRLRYQAPRGTLSEGEVEKLRALKDRIVEFLAREAQRGESLPHSVVEHAPLTYSQLAHWNRYRLRERSAIRQIATATRIRGIVNLDVLRASLAQIIRRHDALRTRIVVVDGVPMQEVCSTVDNELLLDDISNIPEGRQEDEVQRIIQRHILEPVNVAIDPLFRARLLTMRKDESVLIVALEHMISDAVSLSILLRDLFAAYASLLNGSAAPLPAISLQFPEYARWQRSVEQRFHSEGHVGYWERHLGGCKPLRFPEDPSLSACDRVGAGTIPLRIDKELKAGLSEWARLERTTMVMSVFAIYVALVLRWCNASEGVFAYITDGRASRRVENTIGYFSAALYVRATILEADTFSDCLRRITAEYCVAHEHADFSYLTARGEGGPDFTKGTAFNWIYQAPEKDRVQPGNSAGGIERSAVGFTHPMMATLEVDLEPGVQFCDTGEEIVGSIYFGLNRFSPVTMQRFVRNFSRFIEVLLTQREQRMKDILLI